MDPTASPTSFLEDLLRQIIQSTAWTVLLFGAAGGATNALVTKVSLKEAVRLTLIGALVAWGFGSLALLLFATAMNLPADLAGMLVAAGGAAGSIAYFTGVFGGAVIEVILSRLNRHKAPESPEGEGKSDD